MADFRAALAFLTRLPIPAGPLTPRAMVWFPLVGAGLGACWAVVGMGLGRPLGAGAAAAVVLLLSFWLTGGLHLDGFADTVDGLYAPRERALEVMRDSRMGALGGAALTLLLLLQYSLLRGLVARGEWGGLFFAPVAGRFALVLASFLGRGARTGGLGEIFLAKVGPGILTVSAGMSFLAGAVAGPVGLGALAVGSGTAFFAGGALGRRFAGLSGDMLGFLGEVAVTVALGTFVLLPLGWSRW